MRPVQILTGYQDYPDGSALICTGRTRVLCAATIEECVPPWVTSAGWVTAEYAMLPRATMIRTPRSGSARETEIQQLIGRAMRAAIDLDALGPRTITLDCDVIQADGGTRTTAITGAYIALAMGVARLVRDGKVPERVWHSPVAAMSVALLEGQMLLDPCHDEDIRSEVDCDVVMDGEGALIEVHAPASAAFSQQQLDEMLDMARRAIHRLFDLQRQALDHALSSADVGQCSGCDPYAVTLASHLDS